MNREGFDQGCPRADAALDGLREYASRHQVLHLVTCDTVLKRAKREGRAKVAQWLAGLTALGDPRAADWPAPMPR